MIALATVFSQAFESLISHRPLTERQFIILLSATGEAAREISQAARELTLGIHGRGVYVRGLLEITNRCANDCYYCGIRASNGSLERYSLSADQIVGCCREAYSLGLRTFVLQGGQWPALDSLVLDAVGRISSEMPDAAVTLSLGERDDSVYRLWRQAGAARYLLRHETASPAHYASLHPASMSLAGRLRCLRSLRRLGYQVGAGMMIGSPRQTLSDLAADLMFLQEFRPEMVGIGPFIPHASTPFSRFSPGSAGLTLLLISILRLMLPNANIPATTALATLLPDGRERGILAGANVVMPNISPASARSLYSLYDGKAVLGAEAVEGIAVLRDRFAAIGRHIDFSRGDCCGPP